MLFFGYWQALHYLKELLDFCVHDGCAPFARAKPGGALPGLAGFFGLGCEIEEARHIKIEDGSEAPACRGVWGTADLLDRPDAGGADTPAELPEFALGEAFRFPGASDGLGKDVSVPGELVLCLGFYP
jgi:hypothetical protein